MRLIISQFLRTLRERDEFDRLLPELLLASGYVPLSKPQAGVRQYGIDFAAVGESPSDGVKEMLLFVIKVGDISRRDWDNPEPTSIRPSINEALDFYLTKLVPPEYASYRKVIVLATTGDLRQELESVWTGFKEVNSGKASFDFWGGDKVADMVERHLLDENLFVAEDRSDLRKALALAGDGEYDFRDFNRLLLRQLGLKRDGTLADGETDVRSLSKAIRRVQLASQVCVHWAQSEGDARQALRVSERALLWTWHRIHLLEEVDRKGLYSNAADMLHSYSVAAQKYFEVMQPHLYVRDGMAGYGSEGAEFGIVLFEHIGLISTIGLMCKMQAVNTEEDAETQTENLKIVSDGLCALIANNPAAASPRLDAHAIDVSLALLFLVESGKVEEAKRWLAEMAGRLDYCFKLRFRFPVSTDSFSDLVELESAPTRARADELLRSSWCLATVSAWCAILGLDEHYGLLSRGSAGEYSDVCAQLWHPTSEWPAQWYFGSALEMGYSEAPYALPSDIEEMRARIRSFLGRSEYDWLQASHARDVGLWAIDFIACRHFRYPIPASAWYRVLVPKPESVVQIPS